MSRGLMKLTAPEEERLAGQFISGDVFAFSGVVNRIPPNQFDRQAGLSQNELILLAVLVAWQKLKERSDFQGDLFVSHAEDKSLGLIDSILGLRQRLKLLSQSLDDLLAAITSIEINPHANHSGEPSVVAIKLPFIAVCPPQYQLELGRVTNALQGQRLVCFPTNRRAERSANQLYFIDPKRVVKLGLDSRLANIPIISISTVGPEQLFIVFAEHAMTEDDIEALSIVIAQMPSVLIRDVSHDFLACPVITDAKITLSSRFANCFTQISEVKTELLVNIGSNVQVEKDAPNRRSEHVTGIRCFVPNKNVKGLALITLAGSKAMSYNPGVWVAQEGIKPPDELPNLVRATLSSESIDHLGNSIAQPDPLVSYPETKSEIRKFLGERVFDRGARLTKLETMPETMPETQAECIAFLIQTYTAIGNEHAAGMLLQVLPSGIDVRSQNAREQVRIIRPENRHAATDLQKVHNQSLLFSTKKNCITMLEQLYYRNGLPHQRIYRYLKHGQRVRAIKYALEKVNSAKQLEWVFENQLQLIKDASITPLPHAKELVDSGLFTSRFANHLKNKSKRPESDPLYCALESVKCSCPDNLSL